MAFNDLSRDSPTPGAQNTLGLHGMEHTDVDDEQPKDSIEAISRRPQPQPAYTSLRFYLNPRTAGIKNFAQKVQQSTIETISGPMTRSRTKKIFKPIPVLDLPAEIQVIILSFLDVLTLNNASFTCRQFHHLITPKMILAADKTKLKRRIALMERGYRNWEPDYLVCYNCMSPQSLDSFDEDNQTLDRKIRGSAAIRRRCIACSSLEQPGAKATAATQFGYGTEMTLTQLLHDWKDPCQVLTEKVPTSPPPHSTWKLG